MDCCNYVPYKNHYYGTQQYFEPQMPQYPGEYYNNPPPYPDYYGGNTPYYPAHPWQCAAAPFSDYVYNPKEARIRKAMRDASRDRAMGVAPSSRGGRRSQPWVMPESEDQFMMTPTHSMRGVVASPMCGNGFPIGNVGNGQFMQPMHSFSKHMHLMSHEPSPYIQPSPITQLQHQTDMWHQFHQSSNNMRQSQPPQDHFMLPPSQMPTYHHPQSQVPELPPPPNVEKVKVSGDDPFSVPAESSVSPHTNENIPPNSNDSRLPVSEQIYESKPELNMESNHPASAAAAAAVAAGADSYMGVYNDNTLVQNPFDKSEPLKKAGRRTPPKPQKSLPDFNEAFGSTERGRFQSPPDPRLPHKQGYLDYLFTNNDIKFEDYHI